MKMTVNEVSKLTGVSIRTLHYYDEIKLLQPSEYSEAGYRIYNASDLERLQQILFFKELDFPLKEIKYILEQPSFDKFNVLQKQKELLTLKRDRLNRLIELVNQNMKGAPQMSFQEFDMSKIEAAQKEYEQEVKERYGQTSAYREYAKKTSNYNKTDWETANSEAKKIYQAFIEVMDQDVASKEVKDIVARWQAFITKFYYDCTNEILASLGEIYIADERFTRNINQYKEGLAEFMSEAIKEYCKK